MRNLFDSFLSFAVLAAAAAATAQARDPQLAGEPRTLEKPVGEFVGYVLDSGLIVNPADDYSTVFEHTITVDGAAWVRVYFSAVTMDLASTVRLTSLRDGEMQELGADGVQMWSHSSAYFNGDSVHLELIAGPRSRGVRIAVEQVAVQFSAAVEEGGSGQCGICGADDRVASSEDWSARLMPVGCTAAIYNTESCAISAGHCVNAGQQLHFRVPASLPSCDIVNPPINDQFPVLTFQKQSSGVGNDWAVMTVGTNSLGQTPFQRYGQYRPIATAPAASGALTDVVGYGSDTTCVKNQTQQRSPGAVTGVLSNRYEFSNDVRGGNSGSPLLHNNRIIGVVTHCNFSCPPNIGTRVDVPAFVAARNSVCPSCAGDLNGDGKTDQADLGILLGDFGCSAGVGACVGDIDFDGDTDQGDLGVLLAGFGC